MAEAVALDEFGNEIDAEGNVVSPAQSSSRRIQLTPEQRANIPQISREEYERKKQELRESREGLQFADVVDYAGRKLGYDLEGQVAYEEEKRARENRRFDEAKKQEQQDLFNTYKLEGLRMRVADPDAYAREKVLEQEAGAAQPAIDTAAEAATEAEPEEDPISKSIREAYEFGQVEADRAQRAFDAMQERQRLASEQVEREIATAENELKNYSIDPKRAFRSTGSQVMAAFAMAIGAFAEGLSGGKVPNTAFNIIDNAIKRDVEAQKAEMGKYTDVLKNKNNVYARMLQKFGNEEAAMKASITLGLSAAESSIDELVAKYGPDSKQAQVAAGFKARLANDKTKLMLDLAKTNARILGRGKNTGEAQKLFKNALGEISTLRQKFKDLGAGEAVYMQFLGLFGEEAQVTYGTQAGSEYAAARFAVAQFVNKAFSGARGSDRDLAAVMARIPEAFTALDKGKGLQLIRNLEESLERAAGTKGYLVEGDVARYFDKEFGTEGTDKMLRSFKPQIDSIRGVDQ